MKRSRALVSLLASLVLGSAAVGRDAVAEGPKRPHIVYIVSDDQGWKDIGFHGSDIRTPSLDALARGGARLEQFYAQPMCTPSRAALMTGRYPFRYGLQTIVIPSAGRYGLAKDERTLPQALKEAGYKTAISGKWHLGHADKAYWPRQRGFDHQYGALLGEIDYYTHEAHGFTDWFREEETAKEEGYVTQLIGDDAVKVIEGHDAKAPLFLYVAFTAPHAPYQAPKAYLDAYAGIADPNRRAYAAMITAMDDQVGRIVAALDAKKMRDDTLVVFQSDNGGPRSAAVTGEIDMSKATIPCDNGPYRDGKGTVYEGGTRVAALANWPGRIPAGSTVDAMIHVTDMLPTLVGLAGGTTTGGKPLDGVDAWPSISAGKPSARTEVVYNLEPWNVGLRQGDWKLVWRTVLPTKVELFDLSKDPYEKENLAEKEPAKVAELQKRADALSREAAPPLFFVEALGAAKRVLLTSVATPEDDAANAREP